MRFLPAVLKLFLFSVALARLATFKLVILDEMGRLTAERREAVAKRMAELVKDGVVDQVVMIDPAPTTGCYPKKGLTRIDL
jgi:hypothetical protein